MSADKTFEDRLFGAIIDRFFEPQVISTPDGQGYRTPAGLEPMVNELWRTRSAWLLEQVMERLDMDVLVERMATVTADRLAQELNKSTDGYGYGHVRKNTHQADIEKRVRELLAERLVERRLQELDSGGEVQAS